ncbi:MAG: hypothetical protein HYX51_03325 [Chloroflexi bacterium]|nr:hypothetical protein [Chloroflexota bacterium]
MSPAFGLAAGNGPVYAVGFDTDGIVHYNPDNGIQKVLWIADTTYGGAILIRSQRLDQPGTVQLAIDGATTDRLQLPAGDGGSAADAPGWRHWPTYSLFTGPGCYAYQVDGIGFTDVIVFEARPDG